MRGQAPHVLLVDDDVVDVMNVRRAFERGALTNPLRVARDGIEALELLREGPPPDAGTLVLLDLNLPRMNGIELLHEMRGDEALRTTPVVVLTTSADERDLRAAYELGVAGYLVKPLHQHDLVELLAVVMRYWQLAEYL
jgi:CheY-like chemotaxis protein